MKISKIFYFEKLKTWDKLTIVIYIILTFVIYYYYLNSIEDKTKHDLVFGYTIGTHFFIYSFNYKSLRNLTVYFFWLIVGIIHLYLYFQLNNNIALYYLNSNSATGLRNTIILLFIFQILRLVSFVSQDQELVCPSKGNNRKDFFDERRITDIDFLLFLAYFGFVFLLFKY